MRVHSVVPAILLALLAVLPSAAIDFGATIANESTLGYQTEGSFEQVDRVLLWLSLPVGPRANLYVSGFYQFKGDFSPDSSELYNRLDAGRIEFSGTEPGVFGTDSVVRYAVGRVVMGDFSSQVLAGLSDGARVEAGFGNISTYLMAGYRGLLSKDDAYSFIDENDWAIHADDSQYFAPRRGFAGAGVRFSEFIAGHDFGLEGIAQFDLSDAGTKTNTQYIEPFIEGRFGQRYRWRAWGIAELIASGAGSSFSAAAGGMLRFALPELSDFRLTGTALWAGGKAGPMAAFSPIRSAPIDATSFFTHTDILKAGLDASVTPFGWLTLDTGLAGYFRTATTDPEDGVALRSDAAYFRGVEVSAGALFRVASDLHLGLGGAVFVPNTASAYVAGTQPRWSAVFDADIEL